MSYCTIHILTGLPEDISSTISIPNTTVTACGFMVQWKKATSDLVCGPVWYTVTISTEGETPKSYNTNTTNYNFTELSDGVLYHVEVIASNNASRSNAGNRGSAPIIMTTEGK